MKRHPKRARPLWSVAKRRRPIDCWSRFAMDRREPVTITVSVAYAAGPVDPHEGAAVYWSNGTDATVTLDPGTVLVLSPVEVHP